MKQISMWEEFRANVLKLTTSYIFLQKKFKILKYVKLKQQNVSSKVLVTAIDVKLNFT